MKILYVNSNEILKNAKLNKYGIGAFNVHCLEMLPSMVKSGIIKNAPVILQISNGTAEYIGMKLLVNSMKTLVEDTNLPFVLHLDHTKDFEMIKKAIDAGFTSVMIDGSSLSLSENIELTKRVVEYAHSKNVSVEGELGTIGGTEEGISVHEDDIMYTRPEDAQKFLKETNVDALAIAIGTSHGQYKSKAKLNFEILKKINEISDKPLVLHGGTGVSDVDIKTCITNGISKINVGTEVNIAWIREAKIQFEKSKLEDSLRDIIIPCNNKVEDVLINKITLFESRVG